MTLYLGPFTPEGSGSSRGVQVDDHDRVRIIGGRIKNFRVGIDLLLNHTVTVLNTEISDCTTNGIEIDECGSCQFRGLDIHHNMDDGIYLEASFACELVRIQNHDNGNDGVKMTDSDTGEIAPRFFRNGFAGIHLVDAEDNTLLANRCYGNSDYGIVFRGFTGSEGNFAQLDSCYANEYGISLFMSSTGDDLVRNRAFDNLVADLCDGDPTPPCSNTWQ